ncbi:MAG: DUF2071 domain-containing protein [Phycisphaerae bacterium]|nr:DUF2071 domain-containing protein [Gemmatimonadaceae bacterium]
MSSAVAGPERAFLTAEWRDLIMLSWKVDAITLKSHLARGTELDLWEGDAVASVVAFDFSEMRIRGLPVPFHARFPEVNLRFYVRRKLADGTWRRGVSFIKEMVPHALIATAARRLYGEPYEALPMNRVAVPEAPLTDPGSSATRSLVYEWKRAGEWERVLALLTSPPRAMRGGSIEEFLSVQEWGYTRRPDKPTQEFRVEHPRWRITHVTDCYLEADVASLFGRPFYDALSAPPLSTFVAEGSAVSVFPGHPVE